MRLVTRMWLAFVGMTALQVGIDIYMGWIGASAAAVSVGLSTMAALTVFAEAWDKERVRHGNPVE